MNFSIIDFKSIQMAYPGRASYPNEDPSGVVEEPVRNHAPLETPELIDGRNEYEEEYESVLIPRTAPSIQVRAPTR